MRLLFLAMPYDAPADAGAAQTHRIAEELARRGHTVHALCAPWQPGLPRQEVRRGVLIHRVAGRPAAALPALRDLLERTDVLVVQLPFAAVLLAVLVARRLGVTTLLHHVGDPPVVDGAARTPAALVRTALTVLAGRLAAGVIAPSPAEAAESEVLRPLWDALHFVDPEAPAAAHVEALLRRAHDGTL